MKKMSFLLIVFNVLLVSVLTAQVESSDSTKNISLRGNVVDEDGEIVILGTVALYQYGELITGIETDFDGNYSFSNIKEGFYKLEFSYVGYPSLKIDDVEIKDLSTTVLNARLKGGEVPNGLGCGFYYKPMIDFHDFNSGRTYTSEEIQHSPYK